MARDRYQVTLLRESGHWQGERYPAGTQCEAVWNEARGLFDVRMPDGHVIGMWASELEIAR
jgi:hypothetical protein